MSERWCYIRPSQYVVTPDVAIGFLIGGHKSANRSTLYFTVLFFYLTNGFKYLPHHILDVMSRTIASSTGIGMEETQMNSDKLFDGDGNLVGPEEIVEDEADTTIKTEGQATLGDVLESQVDALRLSYKQEQSVKMVEDQTGSELTEYPLAGGPERPRSLSTPSGDPCPECDSERTSSEQRQMGGADEGMTGFHRCTDCGHTWRTGYGA